MVSKGSDLSASTCFGILNDLGATQPATTLKDEKNPDNLIKVRRVAAFNHYCVGIQP